MGLDQKKAKFSVNFSINADQEKEEGKFELGSPFLICGVELGF